MFKYSMQQTRGSIMQNIIKLVKESKADAISIAKKSDTRTMWYFSNKTNRFIAPNIGLEISTGSFCWPSLCVFKENGVAKLAIPSKKITLLEKIKLSSILRSFSKKLQPQNDKANYEVASDYGYHGITTDAELEYIDYQQQDHGR